MSQNGDGRGPASRIIRDRAMAVLRETRARIDPRLLNAMKDHLSSLMPQQAGNAAETASVPPLSPLSSAPAAVPSSPPPLRTKAVYPAQKFDDVPVDASPAMEPVDKQKIAQIVLQYMKNREDTQKH